MLDWIKAVGVFVGMCLLGLLLMAVNALVRAETVGRAFVWSEQLVEWQVQRLSSSERAAYRSEWLASIDRCRESSIPLTALLRATVQIPHLCRQRLRSLAAQERAEIGGWRLWTRTGCLVYRSCIRLFDAVLIDSIRAAVIAPSGRINWGKVPSSVNLSEAEMNKVLRDPKVVRASLLTEADALRSLLKDMPSSEADRPVLERAYGEVVELLRRPKERPLDLPALMNAKEAVLPAARALGEKKRREEVEERRQRLGLA